jgi:hypothetical protein
MPHSVFTLNSYTIIENKVAYMLIYSLSVTDLFFIITDAYHKELTYVEYRAVSGVFQNDDPHPLLHPSSLSSPAPNAGVPGGEGGGGSIFWKTPDIGLAFTL